MDDDWIEGDGWHARSVLTVMQAAEFLGIRRTTAYALAREFLRTNGKSGLPVVRIGNQLRVPRDWLDDFLHGRPIDMGPETEPAAQPKPKRRQRGQDGDVLQLFQP